MELAIVATVNWLKDLIIVMLQVRKKLMFYNIFAASQVI